MAHGSLARSLSGAPTTPRLLPPPSSSTLQSSPPAPASESESDSGPGSTTPTSTPPHAWTAHELHTLLSLIARHAHTDPDPLALATRLNDALHRGDHAADISLDAIREKTAQLLRERSAFRRMLHRQKAPRLTRVLRRSFERALGGDGDRQDKPEDEDEGEDGGAGKRGHLDGQSKAHANEVAMLRGDREELGSEADLGGAEWGGGDGHGDGDEAAGLLDASAGQAVGWGGDDNTPGPLAGGKPDEWDDKDTTPALGGKIIANNTLLDESPRGGTWL